MIPSKCRILKSFLDKDKKEILKIKMKKSGRKSEDQKVTYIK